MVRLRFLSILLCTLVLSNGYGQKSDSLNHKRLTRFAAFSAISYGAAMTALGQIWYSDYDKQSFRFFNDSKEWYQADKLGHTFANYHLTSFLQGELRRTGLREQRATNIAALSAFLIVSSIELYDGHSAGYGASVSDLAANATGALAFWSQQRIWGEQRIVLKYSFHRTDYPKLRPNLLGKNLMEEIIKDYNGQTVWLSVDIDKFTRFPKWLNFSIGYGVEDFVYAEPQSNFSSGFSPYRQYYIGLDFDLSDIPTRSRLVRALLNGLSAIRLPAPALEYAEGRWKLRPLYF